MRHVLVLAAAVAGMFYLSRATVIFGPFTYDEPDYMYAAGQGWFANAADIPSQTLPEFLKLGLDRSKGSGSRRNLSERIRESGDVLFYRHWHGPVYSDWLYMVRGFASDERALREFNFFFPIVAALLMYAGAIWILPGAAGQCAAVLATVMYLWSYPVVRSTELAPHQFFALCGAAEMLLLARMFTGAGPLRGSWYAAVAVCAVSFCTLEIAFAPILTLLICGHLMRKVLKPDFSFVMKSAAAFLAPILVIWPGAIFKLSFVKAYLFMAYLAVAVRDAWGPGATLGETWWLRIVQSPVPWILAAAGSVYFIPRRRELRVLIPLAIFTATAAAAVFPVKTEMARYSLAFWPGLVLFGAFCAGMAIAEWSPRARISALVLISALMLATGWPALRSNLPRQNTRDEAMLAFLRDHRFAEKALLVPHEDLPMVHYYFPEARFKSYYDESTIAEEFRAGGVAGALDRSDPPRWIPAEGAP
ncbi:MAG: hypothetical protein LAO79_09810 [Acidobacteriia bacterium]|nr:hypothetical protein [Terriglobia bacterium]